MRFDTQSRKEIGVGPGRHRLDAHKGLWRRVEQRFKPTDRAKPEGKPTLVVGRQGMLLAVRSMPAIRPDVKELIPMVLDFRILKDERSRPPPGRRAS